MTAKKPSGNPVGTQPVIADGEKPAGKVGTKGVGRKEVDWVVVEVEYRSGVLSNRQLGAMHGVSHTMIAKKAKEMGWVKDLSAAIKAKTDAKVARAVVSEEVATRKLATEAEVVEANAEARTLVVLNHRKDIQRVSDLFGKLMGEIEFETDNLELFERLGEWMDQTEVTDKGRVIVDQLNVTYRRVISTPGRVDSFKKLSDILATKIKLEREAWSIGDGSHEKTDVEALLEAVGAKLGYDQ